MKKVGKRRRLSFRPMSVNEFNSQFHFRFREGEIEEEFELLQEYSAGLYENKTRDIGHAEENKAKNRFVDIVPCKNFNHFNESLIDFKYR